MEEQLLKIIKETIEKNERERKHPTFCTLADVRAEVTRALNNLWAQNKIEVGETFNGKWIKLKNG